VSPKIGDFQQKDQKIPDPLQKNNGTCYPLFYALGLRTIQTPVTCTMCGVWRPTEPPPPSPTDRQNNLAPPLAYRFRAIL